MRKIEDFSKERDEVIVVGYAYPTSTSHNVSIQILIATTDQRLAKSILLPLHKAFLTKLAAGEVF